MKVSPSILSCDFSILKQEIDTVAEICDYIHIDVMDGNFVNNITFGPGLVKDIRKHYKNIFDVHLMLTNPLQYIDSFSDAGADIITIHIECNSNIEETIAKIKSCNKKVGLAINPKTNVNKLNNYLHEIDLILVMSVQPGFGGQKFDETVIDKINVLNSLKEQKGYNYLIEVDGGVNDKTIDLLKAVKVDIVVAGSYIFNSEDRLGKIKTLI